MTTNSLIFKFLVFYGNHVKHLGQWRIHGCLRRFFNADIDKDLPVVRRCKHWQLNPTDYIHSDLFWLGDMDHWDVYHLKTVVKTGAVIFDVGANFGYYSIELATHLKSDCRVYAFEPSAKTYHLLKTHIDTNNLSSIIHPNKIALSDVEQTGFLEMDSANSGAAHLTSKHGAGVEGVALTTLDSFCQKNAIRKIDLIKVDVEGHELHFLKGGQKSIMRFKPTICIELNPGAMNRAGSSCQEVADFIRNMGYELFYTKRKKIIPLVDIPDSGDYVNALCKPI